MGPALTVRIPQSFMFSSKKEVPIKDIEVTDFTAFFRLRGSEVLIL